MNANRFEAGRIRDKVRKGWTWNQMVTFFNCTSKEWFTEKLYKLYKFEDSTPKELISKIDENTKKAEERKAKEEKKMNETENVSKEFKKLVENARNAISEYSENINVGEAKFIPVNSIMNMENNAPKNAPKNAPEKNNSENAENNAVSEKKEITELEEWLEKKEKNKEYKNELLKTKEDISAKIKKLTNDAENNMNELAKAVEKAKKIASKIEEDMSELEKSLKENSELIEMSEKEEKQINDNIRKLAKITVYCGNNEESAKQYDHYVNAYELEPNEISTMFYELTEGELGEYSAKKGRVVTKIILVINKIQVDDSSVILIFDETDKEICEITQKIMKSNNKNNKKYEYKIV